MRRLGFLGFLLLTAILFGFLFSLPSCQKNTDCKANLTILDTTGKPCANATVSLQYNVVAMPPQTNTVTSEITDQTGTADFTFKEPAIYDVDVTYKGKRDTLGIIKLVQSTTVTQTYTFR